MTTSARAGATAWAIAAVSSESALLVVAVEEKGDIDVGQRSGLAAGVRSVQVGDEHPGRAGQQMTMTQSLGEIVRRRRRAPSGLDHRIRVASPADTVGFRFVGSFRYCGRAHVVSASTTRVPSGTSSPSGTSARCTACCTGMGSASRR
jgi:hypothetical protein